MTALNSAQRIWSDADEAVLRILYKEITACELGEILGRTKSAIKNRAQAICISKPGENNGSFRKGDTPWNKGRHFIAGGRSAETRFKAGQMPHSWRPIGTERASKEGYLQRKITDTGVTRRDYVPVHHIVWREAGHEIPQGYRLTFKDKNKRNFALDNLELVSIADLMRRNSFHNYGKEIAQVVQLRGAINRQINKREGKKAA